MRETYPPESGRASSGNETTPVSAGSRKMEDGDHTIEAMRDSQSPAPRDEERDADDSQQQLQLMKQSLQQLQEVQTFVSHDVDGLGKQLALLQQQVQVIARKIDAIETKVMQRMIAERQSEARSDDVDEQ
jgi:hypothetical protein